jgi:hypothetical protein
VRLPVLVVKLHRWLGLLLGLQVILWISGGLVMSAVSIDKVRGDDRRRDADPTPIPAATPLLAPTTAAAALGIGELTGARLVRRLGRLAYHLDTAAGPVMADAATGERLPILTAAEARAVAVADYAGRAEIAAVTRQEEPTLETRGREPPLWRVEFADGRRTTIYIDAVSGEVAARRNVLWRVYDVFWMLHIMDYRARDDFNHPLLVGSAAVAWFLALSGAWLVVLWLKRRARRA